MRRVLQKKQARVDSEEETVVGVNKYKPTEKQNINILSIDNNQVRMKQISNLNKLKESRNNKVVEDFLKKIEQATKMSLKIYWKICIQATKNKCTVGEMTTAMEKCFW